MPTKRDFQRAFFRQTRMKLGLPIPPDLEETDSEREHREQQLPRSDRAEVDDDDK